MTIENINYHLEMGKHRHHRHPRRRAADRGAAFVSLLCICIAFVPMFFLQGVAGFLFAPLAEAVVFAMIASFILSRTPGSDHGQLYLLQAITSGAHTIEVIASHDAVGERTPPPIITQPVGAFPACSFERQF